jgi:hypothetical protein
MQIRYKAYNLDTGSTMELGPNEIDGLLFVYDRKNHKALREQLDYRNIPVIKRNLIVERIDNNDKHQ